MTKVIICAEKTADGPRHFAVDSEATFVAYEQLSENGSNEAAHWGGFIFNIDPDNESHGDADGEDLTPETVNPDDVITMAKIDAARPDLDEDDMDEMDESEIEEAYEDAFLTISNG